MSNIKVWLDGQIESDELTKTVIVGPRHDANVLGGFTKKEVIAYAHKHNIPINSRKKKEELIEIIIRS
ncbi:hypothetical protein UFOVP71_256 [uncultured Caudovirales phage]|uniref:Uncharacterized protein n=1 Tax=uncultured Caudovirales phage TaxID=2100421 RepID=A0A6J5T9V6_9CAUD|nr:hypothetical protein UFOVP71_256 [uncultured Caudovirales phage]